MSGFSADTAVCRIAPVEQGDIADSVRYAGVIDARVRAEHDPSGVPLRTRMSRMPWDHCISMAEAPQVNPPTD